MKFKIALSIRHDLPYLLADVGRMHEFCIHLDNDVQFHFYRATLQDIYKKLQNKSMEFSTPTEKRDFKFTLDITQAWVLFDLLTHLPHTEFVTRRQTLDKIVNTIDQEVPVKIAVAA